MQISDKIAGVNIIGGKVSVTSLNRAGCVLRPPAGGLRGSIILRKFLASKEHLDWLITVLNADEIITV